MSFRLFDVSAQRGIPSLDGLRAISVAFVLFAHLTGTRNFPNQLSLASELGQFGVRVFFIVSGYLITSILCSELRRTGDISLAKFYFRRTLRLLPASYCLIAVVALLGSVNIVRLEPGDLTFALTYLMNFHDHRGWPLGHLWSLAIEEQFYLIWPLALKVCGEARAGTLLVAIIGLAPLTRLASPTVGPAFNFLIWSDALATGCLLSLWRDRLYGNSFYRGFLQGRWFVLVPLVAFTANYLPFTKLRWLLFEPTMNVAIALLVDWSIRNAKSTAGHFLNWRPIRFIGVLSYSLYLSQQIFLSRGSVSPLCAFPLNLVLCFVAALLLYQMIEQPFLSLRLFIEPLFFAPPPPEGTAPTPCADSLMSSYSRPNYEVPAPCDGKMSEATLD